MQKKHTIDIYLLITSIILIFILLFIFRHRQNQTIPLNPNTFTQTTQNKLSDNFIWSGTIQRKLANSRLSMTIAGQLSMITTTFYKNTIDITQYKINQPTKKLASIILKNTPQINDSIKIVKNKASLSVYINNARKIYAKSPLEKWQMASWEQSDNTPIIKKFSYQKLTPVLFNDDFMRDEAEENISSNNLGFWQKHNGTWNIHAIKNPVRSANPFSFIGKGKNAVATAGYWFWRNYEYSISALPLSKEGFGLYFNYTSENNNYSLKWQQINNEKTETLALQKTTNGKSKTIAKCHIPYFPNQWRKLRIRTIEGLISIYIDDKLILESLDPSPLIGGKIGLWNNSETGTVFDDIQVIPTSEFSIDLPKNRPQFIEQNAGTTNILAINQRNIHTTITTKNFNQLKHPIEIQVRKTSPQDYICLRITPKTKNKYLLQIIEVNNNKETITKHCDNTTINNTPTIELHTKNNYAWCNINKQIFCYTQLQHYSDQGICSIKTNPNSSVKITNLTLKPEKQWNSINNRVMVFEHEKSMENWGNLSSEWHYTTKQQQNIYWHQTDFWQDFSYSTNIQELPITPQDTWGIILQGDNNKQLAILISNNKQIQINNNTKIQNLTIPTINKTLRIEKRSQQILIFADNQLVLNLPQPNYLNNLCRLGRIGRNNISNELWANAIEICAAGIKTYSFKKAPTDWLAQNGIWEVTNRWQCDPRWSFFSGVQNNGTTCLWNKLLHGDNITLEFFAGPKMNRSLGNHYSYAADINAVICGDGKNITSGYSFMYGGWDNAASQIVKNKNIIAQNKKIKIYRNKKIHHQWFFIKIRKNGNKLSYWIDNQLVAEIIDPKPLKGKRFGLWTWNNGIMIAQLRISTNSKLNTDNLNNTTNKIPESPYDKK